MATTPNYGFIMPDPTDFVTALPADFEIFGDEVDSRIKALNPETTEGDLAYRGATADAKVRLGIGTAGQVLKVNSGATAPEWGAASAAGKSFTLLNAGGTSLSGGTTTITGLTGNDTFYVFLNGASLTGAAQILIRTNSHNAANYARFGGFLQNRPIADIVNSEEIFRQDSIGLTQTSWFVCELGNAGGVYNGCMKIEGGNSTGNKVMQVFGFIDTGNGSKHGFQWGHNANTAVITQIQIVAGSGTFDAGTVFIFGAQ